MYDMRRTPSYFVVDSRMRCPTNPFLSDRMRGGNIETDDSHERGEWRARAHKVKTVLNASPPFVDVFLVQGAYQRRIKYRIQVGVNDMTVDAHQAREFAIVPDYPAGEPLFFVSVRYDREQYEWFVTVMNDRCRRIDTTAKEHAVLRRGRRLDGVEYKKIFV